jgi:hypothetical protein
MQVVNTPRARIALGRLPCRLYLFTASITQLRGSHVPGYDSTHAIAEMLANTEPWRGQNCSRHQKSLEECYYVVARQGGAGMLSFGMSAIF